MYKRQEYRVNGNSGKWIQGFCRDEQQNLEKERIAGTTDYDELVAGNGIVLLQERADLYDIEAALGDTVEVDYKTESGQICTKTYTDRKSTRLNSSHSAKSRMPSSA